jgi:hypothetical protein
MLCCVVLCCVLECVTFSPSHNSAATMPTLRISHISNTQPRDQMLPMSMDSLELEMPPVVKPLDSFPAFYGTRRFIIVFTKTLLPAPILSQNNPVLTTPSYLSKIHLDIHLRCCLDGLKSVHVLP